MPQELTNAQGQLVWQTSYKTWGSTVAEGNLSKPPVPHIVLTHAVNSEHDHTAQCRKG